MYIFDKNVKTTIENQIFENVVLTASAFVVVRWRSQAEGSVVYPYYDVYVRCIQCCRCGLTEAAADCDEAEDGSGDRREGGNGGKQGGLF